ncbi:MAG: leucine-rich repeat protein, partial [Oscillospiraceae bacterium]|nr:leucine-rich repeat protein [Oscillospiraceae bacterium]
PSNTLAIGEKAFAGCTALEKIYIPSSVTRIGESAFKDCTSLKIDCPDGSVAEEYAVKNSIQLYGKDNSANDTYNDDNSNE